MLYKENFDKIKVRFEEYWAKENHDRPIVSITAPKQNKMALDYPKHISLRDRWLDTEYMIKQANVQMQNTYFGCEAFPMLSPNLGPDAFSAFYGTPIEFGEHTSWSIHNIEDPDEHKQFVLEKEGFYYKKMIEMTKAAVEDGKDKYIVAITDLHPGADALVAMRGPEELCIDTIERPEYINKGALELFNGFRTVCDELYDISTKYQQGSSNWMGIWHPKKWYVTSCDFCCLISPNKFEELIIPELYEELDYLDASMFHLDGPGALKHLDRLLQIDKLNGIQWVYGDGQPTASHWLEVLRKIQNAGKMIQVSVAPEELDIMLESLNPEGVMFNVHAKNDEEAKQLEEKVLKFKRI
ncbi:MAG TPA: trimethylamine corrinoid protein 2 [Ruminiclostridium sp.]